MYISEKLRQYISNSKIVSNSNIIITDLTEIKLSEILEKDVNRISISKLISKDLESLIAHWDSENGIKNDMFCVLNKKCLEIFEDDKNEYSAQMIFPLLSHNELFGLIIFFRTDMNYIATSLKSVVPVIKFTNVFLNEEK